MRYNAPSGLWEFRRERDRGGGSWQWRRCRAESAGGGVAGVIWVLERTWQGLPGRRRFSHPMCDCRSPGGRKSSEGRPFSTATGQVGKTRAGPALSSQALCGETLSHPLHILLQSPRTVQEGAPPLSNSRDGLACRSPRRVKAPEGPSSGREAQERSIKNNRHFLPPKAQEVTWLVSGHMTQ